MTVLRLSILLAAAALAAVRPAAAEEHFPSKAVRIVVPAPAGGGSEISARRLAHKLEPALGQPVIIDARPGASGTLATGLVARAAPDGYTLLFGHIGTFALVPHAMPELGYDPLRDFAPITILLLDVSIPHGYGDPDALPTRARRM